MSDKYMNNLIDNLRGQYFHITSIEGFRGVFESGFIFPNINAKYKTSHTNEYFGAYINSICIFDFNKPTLDQIKEQSEKAWAYFTGSQYKPSVSIFLVIDKNKVDHNIIPNKCYVEANPYRKHIPYIEVWYKEPIPVCWIQKIYVTSSLGYKPKAFKNSGEVFIGIPRFKRNYSRIRGFANNDIDIRNINKLLRFYGKISSNTESSDGYLRKREKELLSQYQNNNGGKP